MFGKVKTNKVQEMIMEEIDTVEVALNQFECFLRAASTPNTPIETLQTLSDAVCKAEASADTALRNMIDSLVKSPLLPATRHDLIEIATSCDRIANKCEHISLTAVFHKFLFPSEYEADILKIFSIIREQFAILKKSINMLFSRFGDFLKDHSILDEIRKHESNVDVIEQELYKRIFALDLGLAERDQIARFVELVCDISDIIENIADQIQIMLITRKA